MRGHHAFESCVEQLATAIRLGVYPRGTTLPRRARARRAAPGLAGDPARGDGRAAAGRAGGDHPRPRRRHRGHAQARHAVGRARPRGSPRPSAGRTGSTRSTTAGSSSPAPPRWPPRAAWTTYAAASSRRRTRRSPSAAQAGRAPAGRLALPPDRRRADRLAAHRRGGDVGAGDAARDAARDPGAGDQHRPLRPPARAAGAGDPGRQAGPGPHGSWRSTATTRPRCCAGSWADDGRGGDR